MTSVPTPPAPDAPGVEIVDEPTVRVHDLNDLLGAVLAALAVADVMLLAAYAHGTTAGVAQDVRGLYAVLGRILVFPVNVLVGVLALVVPVAVLAELAACLLGRRILEVLRPGPTSGHDVSVAAWSAVWVAGRDRPGVRASAPVCSRGGRLHRPNSRS